MNERVRKALPYVVEVMVAALLLMFVIAVIPSSAAPVDTSGTNTLETSGDKQCTTTNNAWPDLGWCTVEHGLGVVPTVVVLTGAGPTAGLDIPVGLVWDPTTATDTTFRVRALNQEGQAIAAKDIRFSWVAKGAPAPPPTTTEPPPPTTTEPPPPTTTPPPPPPPAGYPNALNTGPAAGTVFHDDARCTLSTANEVIDGANFTCAIQIGVTADNVTITNSKFKVGLDNWGSGSRRNMTVEHSYFGSGTGSCVSDFAIGAVNFIARYNFIDRVSDGFRISGQHVDDTIVIEHNFMRGCNNPGDHADGIQANENLSPTTINHNTIDIRDPDGSTDWTGAIFWADNSTGAPTVTDNVLAGGGNVIFIFHFGGPDYVIHDNKVIDGAWEYGPVRDDSCANFDWAGNTLVTVDANYQPTSTVGPLPC